MRNCIKTFVAILMLMVHSAFADDSMPTDRVVKIAVEKLKETILKNQENDRLGFSHRNNYIIEITLSANNLEEIGSGEKIFKTKYETVVKTLNDFNSPRKDFRAYVVVINDWKLRLKEQVNIDWLPKTVNFETIAQQTETNHLHEKKRIIDELNKVPARIKQELKTAGFDEQAIYFGANIEFYTVTDGIPKPRKYKYSTLFLNGPKISLSAQAVRGKIVKNPDASLEDEMAAGIIALTTGLKEIIDQQQQPLVLANHVENLEVPKWFANAGLPTPEPFSGVAQDQQVYDYTGVFAQKKNDLINQLPDPTAKVVITDNLTSQATINNIKAQVAKPLLGNVFWFHLNRKGELHAQIFLAESVKQRIGQEAATIEEDFQKYITDAYAEGGPRIKSIEDLIDFLNIEAHIFKALDHVLKSATIPKSWWDPNEKEYLLGMFGRFAPKAAMTWAFVCGVWNGVIGNLRLVTGLGGLVSQLKGMFYKLAFSSQYREEFFGDIALFAENAGAYLHIGWVIMKSAVIQGLESMWNTVKNSPTGVMYGVGMIVVEVVINIFTAGVAAEIKAGLMTIKLIRVPVEFISKALKAGKSLVKPIVEVVKKQLIMALDGAMYAVRVVDNGVTNTLFRINLASKEIFITLLEGLEGATEVVPLYFENFILKMSSGGQAVEGVLALGKKGNRVVLGVIKNLEEAIDLDKAAIALQANALWKNINLKVLRDYLDNPNTNPSQALKLLDDIAERVKDFSEVQREALLKDLTQEGDLFGYIFEKPRLIDAWKVVSDLPAGKAWVRQNPHILDKMMEVPEKQLSIKEFYSTFTPNGPYPARRNGVDFDEYGFAKFPESSFAPISNKKYFSEALDGLKENSQDYGKAAKWFADNNPNATLANGGQGIVVDGKFYTMHHMEDGLTIMPVLQEIHQLASHTGGASIIRNGLRGLFKIP